MFSQDYLKHVELHAAFDVDILGVTSAQSLRAEGRLLDPGDPASESTEHRILALFQELGPLNYVGQVEVDDVVASDDVWVHIAHEVSPRSEHRRLVLEAVHLRANDWRALLQSEDITHEYLALALNLDDVSDLNHWVSLWSWELASVG